MVRNMKVILGVCLIGNFVFVGIMDVFYRSLLFVILWFNFSVVWVLSKCKWSCWGDVLVLLMWDESILVLKILSKWRLVIIFINILVLRVSMRLNILKSIEGYIFLIGVLFFVFLFFIILLFFVVSLLFREFIDVLFCIVYFKVFNNFLELWIF